MFLSYQSELERYKTLVKMLRFENAEYQAKVANLLHLVSVHFSETLSWLWNYQLFCFLCPQVLISRSVVPYLQSQQNLTPRFFVWICDFSHRITVTGSPFLIVMWKNDNWSDRVCSRLSRPTKSNNCIRSFFWGNLVVQWCLISILLRYCDPNKKSHARKLVDAPRRTFENA